MKKKLLIYAHYYIPDTASTGQILKELAEGLLDQFEVTVICVVPSYLGTVEEEYKTKKYYFENINGVNIVRVRVPEFQKENKFSRIKNILTYFLGAMSATWKVGDQDYILAVSQPPILGGLLGVWGKLVKKIYKKNLIHNNRQLSNSSNVIFIYQIQDFNPEQILAVNYSKNKLITSLMMWIDKLSCKQADLVITVGRDLVETLKGRFVSKDGSMKKNMPKIALINNWIDENEIYPLEKNHPGVMEFKKKYGLIDKFIIMYSGNIGLYYDLEELIKVIKKFKPGTFTAASAEYSRGKEVVFAFVGGGTVLDKLRCYVKSSNMHNVIFIPYQKKEDLIYSLNAGDVHWCVNAKGIKGVSCPSKYYGLVACGKPILGVLEKGSEVRSLIEETNGGLVCDPEDYKRVEENIRWFIENAENTDVLEMGRRGREYLLRELTSKKSISKYAEEILKL